ncbi:MAG: hypothetical protein ACE37K_03705 [Planctomycetota bacterium]
MPTPAGNDPVTAQLRPLLARQLGKLRSRYLLYGLAKALLWTTALVVLFFVLDRWLRLPTPIRLLHTAATVAACGYAIVHFVRYPMSRRFTDFDLAMWMENTYPDLHQRLVSAVQLHQASADAAGNGELRNQSRAMIDRLWQETAERTRELRLDALFDNRALNRVLGGAALLSLTLGIGALLSPETARTFVLRHLGVQVDYPRDTTLIVELPPAGPDLQRTDRAGETELVLPAGADLHVSVLAEGVVPKEAFLDLRTLRDDGATGSTRSVPLTPRPGDRFRHVFRRLSGAFEFRARGGDDDQGDRLVIVRTVRPAQVATLTASIEPPAYTGVDRIEQQGGAIEALVGSAVQLTVQVTAPVREAQLVFLENGRKVPLEAVQLQDDGGASTGFRGAFVLQASDRYQIELVADNGLRNPNPGTYPISALQDYAPVGRWLLPEDDTLALLPTGLLCLRVDARDDFGLTAVDLSIERAGDVVLTRPLLEGVAPEGQPAEPVKRIFPTQLFEVRDLLGDSQTGEGLFARLELRDNKDPAPGTAELPRRIVQIVDPQQLAGLIAKSFRRLRETVEQADAIQQDRKERLAELIGRQQEGANAAGPGEVAQILTGVEVGQGRIQSSIQRVHLGLMRAFDLHLWNRLETSQHAATVVELFREHAAKLTEPMAVDPAFYRDLIARRKAGTLGAMETTLDPILTMIDLTDQLAIDDAPEVARLLAKAQVARGDGDRMPLLAEVQQRQQHIEEVLKQLLLRLEEWNDYQDLVQEVRALRDRQRDLQNRTEEARGK